MVNIILRSIRSIRSRMGVLRGFRCIILDTTLNLHNKTRHEIIQRSMEIIQGCLQGSTRLYNNLVIYTIYTRLYKGV